MMEIDWSIHKDVKKLDAQGGQKRTNSDTSATRKCPTPLVLKCTATTTSEHSESCGHDTGVYQWEGLSRHK